MSTASHAEPTAVPTEPLVLVLNAGSSSLRLAAFAGDRIEVRGRVERADRPGEKALLLLADGDGRELSRAPYQVSDRASALRSVLDAVAARLPGRAVAAVGHRVVHGGRHFADPVRVTPGVLAELEALVPLAPLHQPQGIAGIRAAGDLLPGVPQVACFDTAFHATMPMRERMLGLPRAYFEKGVRRYGFHGLSYESVADRLPGIDPGAAAGRTVVCHLGGGASLCALRAGRSVATTMSFTPLDGLLMGTRAGAVDPGVVLYLLRQEGLSPGEVEHLLDRESGLLGVSGLSPDVRDLLASPAPEAAEAIDLFCYRAAREVGAMAAALGGLDAVVFTGGIGENSPEVRERVCEQLGWLGVALDPAANRAGAARLHAAAGRVSVLRVPADEERVIARQAARAITHDDPPAVGSP